MTLPDERIRAIKWAREFMRDLLDPAKTPRVPRTVRSRAYSCLKHYPADIYILEVLDLNRHESERVKLKSKKRK